MSKKFSLLIFIAFVAGLRAWGQGTTAPPLPSQSSVSVQQSSESRLQLAEARLAAAEAAEQGEKPGVSTSNAPTEATNAEAPQEAAKAVLSLLPSASDGQSSQNAQQSATPQPPATPSLTPLQHLDQRLVMKGWYYPAPRYSDSNLLDYGGWRSKLAKAGFGLLGISMTSFQENLLDTPSQAPLQYASAYWRRKAYAGQSATYNEQAYIVLTYDTSKWGVPDGQIILMTLKNTGNDALGNIPSVKWGADEIAWYQTLFAKKVELKLGLVSNTDEFIGSYIGGMFANTFGSGASIPLELGLSVGTVPSVRFTWHITDTVYEELGVQRSYPTHGPTGNPWADESNDNPHGLAWNSSIPGTGEWIINEFGYKQNAAPGKPYTWARFTTLYNNGVFTDFSQLAQGVQGATIRGNNAQSFLLYRQIWQQNPSSAATAYRGIYAGVSYQYAPVNATPVTSYYQGRIYWKGPARKRSSDMAQLVYTHNEFNKYRADFTNLTSSSTGLYGQKRANSYLVSYTAHVKRGIYGSGGLSYTDTPSSTYFMGEGSALNFMGSMVLIF